jgi:hypothetical protein
MKSLQNDSFLSELYFALTLLPCLSWAHLTQDIGPGFLPGHYPYQPGDSLYLRRSCSWLFQVNIVSFTWKWHQRSAERIPHSVSKEMTHDLTEGAVFMVGQLRPQWSSKKAWSCHTSVSWYQSLNFMILWTVCSFLESTALSCLTLEAPADLGVGAELLI